MLGAILLDESYSLCNVISVNWLELCITEERLRNGTFVDTLSCKVKEMSWIRAKNKISV
jgi:hypothetical protein